MIDRFAKIIVEVKEILRAGQRGLVPTRRVAVKGETLDSLPLSHRGGIQRLSHVETAFGDNGDTQLSQRGRCFQIDFTLEHRNVGIIDSNQAGRVYSSYTFLCSKVESI